MVIPALEAIGERLYSARAAYMLAENVGLTITYNRLKNPDCTDARILDLRALHEELDREVLRAYAWDDLFASLSPFCIATNADKNALETFERDVVDRLFALNARRADEERIRGLGTATKQTRARPVAATPSPSVAAPSPQLSLIPGGAARAAPATSLPYDLSMSLAPRLRRVLKAASNAKVAGLLDMDATTLVLFDRYAECLTRAAREEIGRRVRTVGPAAGADVDRIAEDLPPPARAASGAKQGAVRPTSFADLLDDPAIPSTDREAWRKFAE